MSITCWRCCRSSRRLVSELGGPPCTYVGHPLTERLSELRPNELERRLRLADPPLFLVLPGSRTGEIRRMAPVFGAAIARVAEQFGAIEVVVPAVPQTCGDGSRGSCVVARSGARDIGCRRER